VRKFHSLPVVFVILTAGSTESDAELDEGALDWSAFAPVEQRDFHFMGLSAGA
jgi:hypothetical protein